MVLPVLSKTYRTVFLIATAKKFGKFSIAENLAVMAFPRLILPSDK
ncbi:MAG: hypothetical protein MUE44_15160 [Oscillatoriaceae cyanobacterium Prado104]|jgi:hypothetical protein|nr:hypothetical protein [Oscillatoriaceae cyanobacterium Prado104]